MSILRDTLVSSWPAPPNHEVITIDSKLSVASAHAILMQHNILSAPVYDAELQAYVGMIDMADVVEFVISTFQETEVLGHGFLAMMEQVERIHHAQAKNCADLSRRNPFVMVLEQDNLLKVAELLSARWGVHRVNVFNKAGKLSNIITQSSLINFLARNLSKLGPAVEKTIAELHLGSSPVITVETSIKTAEAFNTLRQHNISAVPVVNSLAGGGIIANISVRDIREIASSPENMYRLYQTVGEFVASTHDREVNEHAPAITCTKHARLGDVILKLAANRIHRVYVVDHSNFPVAVISLGDVLTAVVAATAPAATTTDAPDA